ncbi:MAG: hypothetical protein R3E89_02265 [Thiolinea sp.]
MHQIALEQLAVPREVLEAALLEDYAGTGQKGAIPFLPGRTQRGRTDADLGKDRRRQRQQRHGTGAVSQ